MKTKFDFDCWLTISADKYDDWYFHFLPRVTMFSSHLVEDIKDYKGETCLCNIGKEYDLQIGWLCFEISISVERRTR